MDKKAIVKAEPERGGRGGGGQDRGHNEGAKESAYVGDQICEQRL